MRSTCLVLVLTLGTFAACKTPDMVKKDMLRDARIGCERGDAAACFHAGELFAEESGGAAKAQRAYAKGCGLRHAASCDALAAAGPEGDALLAEACRAGDLLSCVRRAERHAKDAAGAAQARAELARVCRSAATLNEETPARDVLAASAACGAFAAAARGDVGATDSGTALRLELLAAMLRIESLYRLEREEDTRSEQRFAKPVSSAVERDLIEREAEAMRRGRTELVAAIEADGKVPSATPPGRAEAGLPLTAAERVFFGGAFERPAGEAPAPTADPSVACRLAGDPVACAIAGASLAKSDPDGAVELHAAGCSKRPEQCWGLVGYAEHLLRTGDFGRAAQLLEKGCDGGSALACARLAAEHEQGERGVPLDLVKASRLYDRACEAGASRACAALAAMVEDGRGAPRNAARAKQLRVKADGLDRSPPAPAATPAELAAAEAACRGSRDAAKCSWAAGALRDLDAVKAEELLRVGCAASAPSCGLWGFAVDRFRKDDPSRGTRVLEQGCQEGAATACAVLADIHHAGFRTVARAEPRASELYRRACELGDAAACRAAAARARAGVGSPKDPAKADELRARAAKVDQASPAGADAWARGLEAERARGPWAAELERARDAARTLLGKAREREQLRSQRAESALSGRRSPALPPPDPADAQASAERRGAIVKLAQSIPSTAQKPAR